MVRTSRPLASYIHMYTIISVYALSLFLASWHAVFTAILSLNKGRLDGQCLRPVNIGSAYQTFVKNSFITDRVFAIIIRYTFVQFCCDFEEGSYTIFAVTKH